jgi:hypothetical protein
MNVLDQELGYPLKGGWERHPKGRMSNVGDGGTGDLSQIWMECSKAYRHLDCIMC